MWTLQKNILLPPRPGLSEKHAANVGLSPTHNTLPNSSIVFIAPSGRGYLNTVFAANWPEHCLAALCLPSPWSPQSEIRPEAALAWVRYESSMCAHPARCHIHFLIRLRNKRIRPSLLFMVLTNVIRRDKNGLTLK